MMEETLKAVCDEKEQRIEGTFPEIIVEGTAGKPYFCIRYIDRNDGECYVGFGSYYLENVFNWLKEYFGPERACVVDPEELRPKGRWVDGHCSECGIEALSSALDEPIYDYDWEENLQFSHTETHIEYHETNFCPNCGADMRGKGHG